MLALGPIIDALKLVTIKVNDLDVPAFAFVGAITDEALAIDATPALPAALVLPGSDSGGEPANKWTPRQVIVEYVSILIVVRNLSDPRGEAVVADLSPRSAAVRKALVGHRQDGKWPLMFGVAGAVGFDDQIFVWAERFLTRSELVAVA